MTGKMNKEETAGSAGSVDVEKLVRPVILSMQAYQTQNIENVVRLDANENPFPWPEGMKKVLMDEEFAFNRYPDGGAAQLKQAIARYMKVTPSSVVTGNGGDELIQLVLTVFGGVGKSLVLHPPTFSMYYAAAKLTNTQVIDVPLLEGKKLDLEEMLKAGKQDDVNVILVCNPNNPTGALFPKEDILHLIEETGKIVVVDEAYSEFSQESMVGELDRYPNLILLRTFSKAFGLAGLRLGYLLGQPTVMELINRARQPFNVNSFSQRAGVAALEFLDQFQVQIEVIRKEIQTIYEALKNILEIEIFPTRSNFILFKPRNAELWYDELLRRGFLVRYMGNLPVVGKCLRLSAGQPQENERLIAALQEINQEE